MNKILSIKNAVKLSKKLQNEGKKIVLAGGCFDILHIGHIDYLTKAKKQGDILFVFLESDENIKKIKDEKRPINTQADRATILASLSMVDYVIPLPLFRSHKEYDELVISLKPGIIATTKGDSAKSHKERQAGLIGAKVIEVTNQIVNKSTTKLLEILTEL
ncbi:MAG TPA: adenylyltransferase/cytidyltransferase family protein [Candidatus Saccharimonadales bacterium]|nr:adenylyltransferase/cytidyltransferase family protein [Candidatus Saccharimonadales bacterium]